MTRVFRAFRLALAFLTVVPIPIREDEANPRSLADSRFAYPVVGLLIGFVLAGLGAILGRFGAPGGPSAFLLVATLAALTGGLHLDGLADTADGLFLHGDPSRRLEVMRDPRVGSFGVVALILVLLGKFSCLGGLGHPGRSWAVLASATAGRCGILIAAGLASYARPEGTGRILVDATRPRDSAFASAFALVVGGLAFGIPGVVAATMALGPAAGLAWLAHRRLGGVTGDILGASVEVGELAFLLALALMVG